MSGLMGYWLASFSSRMRQVITAEPI